MGDAPNFLNADEPTRVKRLEHVIEVTDRPLLGLAVISMVLYLLDLRGLPEWAASALMVFNLLTDAAFLADLVIKLMAHGRYTPTLRGF